ncbi:hypothetical protein A2576_01595 [Candidatus Amesbacteria bacterium RIFOXYD1_FULL_47_9]|uniref:Uncharacterized protein n=1 Tax=Candidatus Amesbacteria bacterium RIFOXYD1_FULL_47_9 TaxID=1797267 RepID=A0A1F5A2I9_9BACT|nr:MAG: hypothetical protein UW51_C0005G0037 [Candidatus Amesbacteria bacterium GW2011_GWA1_44_24]KKU31594.1 MAG: hypothetical protein UX46_C0004G0037 [Candidatus Amesbacteria bacterium GW2011_GWC1_46_24]KKU67367.1 MAG: hypothetical protein UX91_C0004G0037 [Candidatus Amesbacteria bacterium GW2011_GWB1_47_19]OGD05218.1 MAG: hypothetical protein A2379_04390 [Candidatus Amesbacteria bacterium RIFOXYB1_FULL_47_13]OGD12296.1 MAG: hypothetical protein A2576_01595 [Candidatus Amesbacteria bacterium R
MERNQMWENMAEDISKAERLGERENLWNDLRYVWWLYVNFVREMFGRKQTEYHPRVGKK